MKRKSGPPLELPQIIAEALRTKPLPPHQASRFLKDGTILNADRINQLLEENANLLPAIQENLVLRRLQDCVKLQKRLHQNLRLLGSLADSNAIASLEGDMQETVRRILQSAPPPAPPGPPLPPSSPPPSSSSPPSSSLLLTEPAAAASNKNNTQIDDGLRDLVAAMFPRIAASRAAAANASSSSSLLAPVSDHPARQPLPPSIASIVHPEDIADSFLNLESSNDRPWLPTSKPGHHS